DNPRRCNDPARLDSSGAAAFKDPTTSPFDALSEAPDELGWMDRSAMRREGATDRVGGVQPFPGSFSTEQGRAQAKPIGLRDLVSGARQLCAISSKHDRATKRYIRVDALRFRHAHDLAYGFAHRPIVRPRGVWAVTCGHCRCAGREQGGTPSAITSGR